MNRALHQAGGDTRLTLSASGLIRCAHPSPDRACQPFPATGAIPTRSAVARLPRACIAPVFAQWPPHQEQARLACPQQFRVREIKSRSRAFHQDGEPSQCGGCFCDGRHLPAPCKGRCAAILTRSVRGPFWPCAPHAACGGPLQAPVRHLPFIATPPHRIGTDRLTTWRAVFRLQEEGRSRACSEGQKLPLNAWPRSEISVPKRAMIQVV